MAGSISSGIQVISCNLLLYAGQFPATKTAQAKKTMTRTESMITLDMAEYIVSNVLIQTTPIALAAGLLADYLDSPCQKTINEETFTDM